VPVSGQHHFAQISAGRHHTCGVSDSGESFCWGLNDWGQLGNADTVASTVPVGVSGPVSLVSVSAGGDYTCGLTSAGAAHCWGRNTFGVLGAGAGFYSDVPMEVQGGVTFASLSTGISQHNCGFRPGGAAYCWGSGSDGQLGSGVIGAALVPTAVGAP
jgi:alpha-tubulin suppressor-like RCC1 family protein